MKNIHNLISLTSILKFMIHEFYVNDFRYIVPSGLGRSLCLIDIRRCVAFSYHQLQWTNQYIKLTNRNFCHVLIKLHYFPFLPEYFIIFKDQHFFVFGYLLFYFYCHWTTISAFRSSLTLELQHLKLFHFLAIASFRYLLKPAWVLDKYLYLIFFWDQSDNRTHFQ